MLLSSLNISRAWREHKVIHQTKWRTRSLFPPNTTWDRPEPYFSYFPENRGTLLTFFPFFLNVRLKTAFRWTHGIFSMKWDWNHREVTSLKSLKYHWTDNMLFKLVWISSYGHTSSNFPNGSFSIQDRVVIEFINSNLNSCLPTDITC